MVSEHESRRGVDVDDEIPRKSHSHLIDLLKWPIVYMLVITSFPAGFMPLFTTGAYRGILYAEHVNPKWRNQMRIDSAKRTFWLGLCLSIVCLGVHLAMIRITRRQWNDLLFGLRGAGWFVILWSAFAFGVAMGIWIYTVAPE
jgi:hypothetical protein